jgi:hypothetical protein
MTTTILVIVSFPSYTCVYVILWARRTPQISRKAIKAQDNAIQWKNVSSENNKWIEYIKRFIL